MIEPIACVLWIQSAGVLDTIAGCLITNDVMRLVLAGYDNKSSI